MHPPRYMLVLAGVLSISCGGGGDVTAPPTTGTLEITTSTEGTEPDADGYTIQMDADPFEAIGSVATIRKTEVSPGTHALHLAGLAANCTLAGGNPRSTTISAGETTNVTFVITCGATTGTLRVTSSTTGTATDPDGYSISLDGADRGPIGVNEAISIEQLPPEVHVLGLTGVAANCQVQGENLRAVTVTAGASITASFAIVCVQPPANAGTLRITTASTGPDQDADGYSVAVDARASQPIGVNAAISLANIAAGPHTVQLSGVAANCSIQGTNPRTVAVSGGTTAEASFAVSCAGTTGTIRVSVATSGSPIDPDGYAVKLDGAEPGKVLPIAGAVTFSAVAAGSHSVVLGGIATNCTVAEGASRNISVAVGATVEVAFTVTCGTTSGSIEVTTATSGFDVDPDGYTVSIDGGAAQTIGRDSKYTFGAVTPGSHQVELAGFATNCRVDGDNPRGVVATAGASVPLTFIISCASIGVSRWTSISVPAGFTWTSLWASSASNIFLVGYNRTSPFRSALFHYDGQQWVEQIAASYREIMAVWGSSPTEVFAVGYDRALRYNGAEWVDIPMSPFDLGFAVIWGTSSQDLWAGGSGGGSSPASDILQHYDGASWGDLQGLFGTYGDIFDIAGTSPSDVYLIGRDAPYDADPEEQYTHYAVMHYDGSSWRPSFESTIYPTTPPGEGVAPTGVWAIASNDVFVVALRGRLLHFNGTAWSAMTSPTTQHLADVWGRSGHDVYAVGSGGIFRYDGVQWALINSTPASRVWGAGTDVFAISEGVLLYGSRE